MSFLVAPPLFSSRGTSLINTLANLGLTTNLRICLDAGDLNSYDGTSQTWKDLSGGRNDFVRGATSSSQSSDPTFHGTAGNLSGSEYFSCDGGDYFTLASGSNPSWVNTFHKANAKCTLAAWAYANDAAGSNPEDNEFMSVGTVGSSTVIGFAIGNGVGDSLYRIYFNGFNNGAHSTFWNGSDIEWSANKFTDNAWNFISVSFDDVAGMLIYSINGQSDTRSKHALSPSTSDATGVLTIGAIGTQFPEDPGDRFSQVAVWDRALSAAELLALYNATKSRFGG